MRHLPSGAKLERAKPIYETLPGWKCDIRGVTDYNALPPQAKDYVAFIEERIKTPIKMISTGPRREDICNRLA